MFPGRPHLYNVGRLHYILTRQRSVPYCVCKRCLDWFKSHIALKQQWIVSQLWCICHRMLEEWDVLDCIIHPVSLNLVGGWGQIFVPNSGYLKEVFITAVCVGIDTCTLTGMNTLVWKATVMRKHGLMFGF